MKKYKVEIIETYKYEFEIEASSKEKAIIEAQKEYENPTSEYVFCASAITFEDVKFRIKNK